MENKSYSLVDLSKEELEAFDLAMKALLDEHKVHFEGIPAFTREKVGEGFQIAIQYIAKKKVELVPKEGELSPIQPDDLDKKI